MNNYALNLDTSDLYDIHELTDLLIQDNDKGEVDLIEQLYIYAEEILDEPIKEKYKRNPRSEDTIQSLIMAITMSFPETKLQLSNGQTLVIKYDINEYHLHQNHNEGGAAPIRNNSVEEIPVSHLSQEDMERHTGLTPLDLQADVETSDELVLKIPNGIVCLKQQDDRAKQHTGPFILATRAKNAGFIELSLLLSSQERNSPCWKAYMKMVETEDKFDELLKKVVKIILPQSLKELSFCAFTNMELLTEIVLPEGLEKIDRFAFSGCMSLRHIDIPTSIVSLGNNIFSHCYNLVSIDIPEDSKLQTLGESIFKECRRLEHIVLPQRIKKIPAKCFELCTSLREIDLSSIEEVGGGGFLNCTSLISVVIPERLTKLGYKAFEKCISLERVVLLSKLESLSRDCFKNCNSSMVIEFRDPSYLPGGSRDLRARYIYKLEYLEEHEVSECGSITTCAICQESQPTIDQPFVSSTENMNCPLILTDLTGEEFSIQGWQTPVCPLTTDICALAAQQHPEHLGNRDLWKITLVLNDEFGDPEPLEVLTIQDYMERILNGEVPFEGGLMIHWEEEGEVEVNNAGAAEPAAVDNNIPLPVVTSAPLSVLERARRLMEVGQPYMRPELAAVDMATHELPVIPAVVLHAVPQTGTRERRTVSRENARTLHEYNYAPQYNFITDICICADTTVLSCNCVRGTIQRLEMAEGSTTFVDVCGTPGDRRNVDGVGSEISFVSPYRLCQISDGSIIVADEINRNHTVLRRMVMRQDGQFEVKLVCGNLESQGRSVRITARDTIAEETNIFFITGLCATLDGAVIYTEAATQKVRRVQILEYQIDTTPFHHMTKKNQIQQFCSERGSPIPASELKKHTVPRLREIAARVNAGIPYQHAILEPGFVNTVVGGGIVKAVPGYSTDKKTKSKVNLHNESNSIVEYVDGSFMFCDTLNGRIRQIRPMGRDFEIVDVIHTGTQIYDCVCDLGGRVIYVDENGIFMIHPANGDLQPIQIRTDIPIRLKSGQGNPENASIRLHIDLLGNLLLSDGIMLAMIPDLGLSPPYHFTQSLGTMFQLRFQDNFRLLPNEVRDTIKTILLIAQRNKNEIERALGGTMDVNEAAQNDRLNLVLAHSVQAQDPIMYLPLYLWKYCLEFMRVMDMGRTLY